MTTICSNYFLNQIILLSLCLISARFWTFMFSSALIRGTRRGFCCTFNRFIFSHLNKAFLFCDSYFFQFLFVSLLLFLWCAEKRRSRNESRHRLITERVKTEEISVFIFTYLFIFNEKISKEGQLSDPNFVRG